MRLFASHWAWLFVLLALWSAWDFVDHVSRPGSPFEAAAVAWFGFTFASCLSFWVIAWSCAIALERARLPELAASALGVAVAVLVHLRLTGPLWDRLFWDRLFWDGALHFHQVAAPMAAAVGLYLVFRLVFAGVLQLAGRREILRT